MGSDMVRTSLKIFTHGALSLLAISIVLLGLTWTDPTPPSYVIAMWVIPHEFHTEEPITARLIFVRNYLCYRHIEHSFVQSHASETTTNPVPETVYILAPPPDLLFPTQRGLIANNFDFLAPKELTAGSPAMYIMKIAWSCWWNPISWVDPWTTTMRYETWVLRFGDPEQGGPT